MLTDGDEEKGPRTVEAYEFEVKCRKLMDEVAERGEELVITKYGQPLWRLLPYRETPRNPFGRDRDILRIHGDLDEPIDVEWDAVTGRGFGY